MGEVRSREPVLVRVHSECFTGDVLGSQRCDCGEQLQQAMRRVAEVGRGIIIYQRMRHLLTLPVETKQTIDTQSV
jgi:3,4-dihydroxy 2-butanone 4-phosphate synthase/GTP cyclohydrolase II